MNALLVAQNGGVSCLTLRVKAPRRQILGQLPLSDSVIFATQLDGGLLLGVCVGHFRKATLAGSEAAFPGGQQFLRFLLPVVPALFIGGILWLQQNVADVHPGGGGVIGNCLLGVLRQQIIPHGGEIHIAEIISIRGFCQAWKVGPHGLGHLGRV